MATTLTSSYQYIGRSNAVGSPSGYEYYILMYAKTSGDSATGKHTVTVKMRLACNAQSSFYGWGTTGSATVAGKSAFSWSWELVPNEAWTFSDITVGDYKYRAWVDLKEGSVEVDVGYGVTKDINISSSWVMESSYSENWFPYTGTYAKTSVTVTLPMIAGASIPTVSASTVKMGKTVTITTNRKSASFTHKLTYSFGGSTGTIASDVGASCTWTVPVMADKILNSTSGTCTITCVTYSGSTPIGTATVDLTLQVPDATTPTVSVSTVKMGNAVTINTSRNAASFTHKLTYSFGGAAGTIASDVGTSYAWTVPDLADKITNSTSGKCTITCVTYNGSASVGSVTVDLTLQVPSATTPTLSASSVKMGNVVKVSVENKGAGNFTHDITYSIGDYSDTLYKSLKQYVNWTVPKSLANYTSKKTSATCTITCVTYNGTAKVGTTQVTLTLTVPDKTVPTLSASSVAIGEVITVSLPRETSAYVHDISMSLTAYGSSTVVRTATVATGANTSYGWEVPMFYAGLIPAATKGTITLTVTTRFTDSTTEIGRETVSFTMTVPNNSTTRPKVSVTLSSIHSLPSKFDGLYIQGKSSVAAIINATSDYSTISTYEMTVDGNTKQGTSATFTSDVLETTGSLTVKITATDARGYSTSIEKTISVIPYSNPRVIPYGDESNVVCVRCLSNGTPNTSGKNLLFKAGRRYSPVVVNGVQLNFCYLRYRTKLSTASEYGSWQRLIAKDDLSINEISVTKGSDSFSTTSSYDVQVNAYDDAGFGHTITFNISTDEIDFHMKKGEIAFGKYAEFPNAVEINEDWDLYLHGYAINDHIIERGESGGWSYIYYASGLKMAWIHATFSNVAFTAYGSVYRSEFLLFDKPPSPSNVVAEALSYQVSGYGLVASTWFGQLMFASAANPTSVSLRAFTPVETTQDVRVRVLMLYR